MNREAIARARILVVDDEEANVRLLEAILHRAGCTYVESTTDPRQVEAILSELDPDLVLLDLHMPHLSGFDVMDRLRSRIPSDEYLPVLVLTADVTWETKRRALADGAADFLTKPLDPAEVMLRVGNLLQTRFLHRRLRDQNVDLEEKVRARTWELEAARNEVLERLALAAEYRDDDTGQHIRRVGLMAASLAETLDLPETQVELIARTAPLHDVGKIGVPDAVLLKPTTLTPDEFEQVKAHTTIGAKILAGDSFPLLAMAREIAATHHERWNGSGYPLGLREGAIPLTGRIVAVADAFDAMTNDRPYRKAGSTEEAIAEVAAHRGSQFDPDVVDAFMTLLSAEDFLERAKVG